MTLNGYQKESRKTATYAKLNNNYIYPTLGLVGEAGEVAEKVKRIIRLGRETFTEEEKTEIEKELGDVLWYMAQLSTELGLSLENVALHNIEKLKSRLIRRVINASGDNR